MDTDIKLIRNTKFQMSFWKTLVNADGNKIDMYLLNDDKTGEGLVSFGVPHGHDTIAKFVVKCCNAGVKVLNTFNITSIDQFRP